MGAWLIYAVFAIGGIAIAAAFEKLWLAPVLIVVAILGGGAWFAFAIVQTVLQVIDIVQRATSG